MVSCKTVVKSLIMLIVAILLIPQTAFADAGPKPSITVYVKNYKTQSYYLDLLTRGGMSYEKTERNDKEAIVLQKMPLYRYREGGWLATSVRNFLVHGDLKGKYDKETGYMVHRFYYLVPGTFKVIVQYENKDLVVSNVITVDQFNSQVLLDLKTGKLTKLPPISYNFRYFLFLMVLTIIIELFIALLFNYKKYALIVKANILTQILLQATLVLTFNLLGYYLWYAEYFALEILVVIIEFVIYKIFSKEYNWIKLLEYTIAANFTTFIIGLLLVM